MFLHLFANKLGIIVHLFFGLFAWFIIEKKVKESPMDWTWRIITVVLGFTSFIVAVVALAIKQLFK